MIWSATSSAVRSSTSTTAVAERGGIPGWFVLATKVDPAPGSSDFSGARVRASVAESLERLGLDRLQLVYLHDPERISFDDAIASDGPIQALVALRDEGVIGHLGVAGYPIDLMRRYLDTGAFEVVLTHNQFTLLHQGAAPLLDDAVSPGIAVVNAAPYGGGILAKGPELVQSYCYRPASPDTLDRARLIAKICADADVPLAAAALQFSMRDPLIVSTVVGIGRVERVAETVELATWPIPAEIWTALEALTESAAQEAP